MTQPNDHEPTDKKNSLDDHPLFGRRAGDRQGQPPAAEEGAYPEHEAWGEDESGEALGESQDPEEESMEELDQTTGHFDGDDESEEGWQEPGTGPGDAGPKMASSSAVPLVLGTLSLLAGVAMGVMKGRPDGLMTSVTETLVGAGLTPAILVVVAAVLLGVWITGRAAAKNETQTRHEISRIEEGVRRHEQNMDYLVEAQGIREAKPPASGEELDRVLMALTRQDEKVTNLTRAIKMYGKPLVEITDATSDLMAEMEKMGETLQTIATASAPEDSAIADVSDKLDSILEGYGRIAERQVDAHRDAVSRLKELSDAVHSGQDAMEGIRGELDQLIGSNLDRIEKRLEAMTSGLATDLEKLGATGAGNNGADIERSVNQIQREISGMVATLSQLQGKVVTAPAQAQASAPAGNTAPPGGLAQSIAGTSKAKGGKNVLGAIAKLKSMRDD